MFLFYIRTILDSVDFTDSATEPVISFMVVNNLGR